MEYLRRVTGRRGPARINEIFKTIRDTQRSDYPTSKAVIADLQYWYSQGDDTRSKPSAYNLMMRMPKELSNMSYLGHFMHIKRVEFHYKDLETMATCTIDGYCKGCVRVLNDLRLMEEKAEFVGGSEYAAVVRDGRGPVATTPPPPGRGIAWCNARPRGTKMKARSENGSKAPVTECIPTSGRSTVCFLWDSIFCLLLWIPRSCPSLRHR